MLPSPSPTENTWKGAALSATVRTGQLSPISSGMDTALDSSSVPTTAHSAASSCTDSWSIGGYVDQDDGDNDTHWDRWEPNQDLALAVPKLEPSDDDVNLSDVKAVPLNSGQQQTSPNGADIKQKRPRGRPRKHPLTPAVSTNKVTKGRSKTGCITCRKRKKKCDEAKPRCEPRLASSHLAFPTLDSMLTILFATRYELREKRSCLRRLS